MKKREIVFEAGENHLPWIDHVNKEISEQLLRSRMIKYKPKLTISLFVILPLLMDAQNADSVTILDSRHYSNVFGEIRNYRIFLPRGYFQIPHKKYPVIYFLHAGNYRLAVVDQNNCSASTVTTILNDKPKPVFLGNDTTLCPGDRIILSPGTYSNYSWQDNSVSSNYVVTNPGIYTVQVTDDLGCTLKDTLKIIGDCGFIFFPNAITPNNDTRNDFFGPLGVLSTVKDYTLLIYNRMGQLIFKSTDPLKKWDGKVQNNRVPSGTYVWIATYSNKGKTNILQKGTVTVIH